MGAFHKFRVIHNRFVNQLDGIITSIVDGNDELVQLNRDQLAAKKNVKDATIRPKYSRMWAAVKGFSDPDLKYTGDMYESMTITATPENFYIQGHTDYTEKLIAQYSPDIFGIAKSKLSKAKQITTTALAKVYKSTCYKNQ